MSSLSNIVPAAGALATASPIALSLKAVDALATGLQMTVDGQQVLVDGLQPTTDPPPIPLPIGWTASATQNGDDVDVVITVPGGWWPDKSSVFAYVEMVDGAGVKTPVTFAWFDVGDLRGPQMTAVTPGEGDRGLPLVTDLVIDITSTIGVDTASLIVDVDGLSAWSGGSGQGDWSTSTLTPIVDGQRLTLKKPSGYANDHAAFVDARVSDTDGNAGERRVFRYHFGTTVAVGNVVHGLTGTVVRVIAYDLTSTAFGDPQAREHTGFAWDGQEYDAGSPTGRVASWFTELGAFPLAGQIVVTSQGWAIVPSLAAGAWASCVARTAPEWSMAGTGVIVDADFGPEPTLVVASQQVTVVDFAADAARGYSQAGRELGAGDVTARADDQRTGTVDSQYSLPAAGALSRVACVAKKNSLVFAVSQPATVTVVDELDGQWLAEIMDEEGVTIPPAPRVTRQLSEWTSAVWVRARIDDMTLILAFDDGGQGAVEVWDWFQFAIGGGYDHHLDDASTPALATGTVADVDIRGQMLAAAMAGEVDVVDLDTMILTAHDLTDLGLGAGALLSVALETGAKSLYAANATGVSCHDLVTDTSTIVDTLAAISLSAIGSLP